MYSTITGLSSLLEAAPVSDEEAFSLQRRLFALADEISGEQPGFFTERTFLQGELHLAALLESCSKRFDLPAPFAQYLEQRLPFIRT